MPAEKDYADIGSGGKYGGGGGGGSYKGGGADPIAKSAPKVSEDDVDKLNRIADANLMALAAMKTQPELQSYHPSEVAQAFSNAIKGAETFGKYSTIGLLGKFFGYDPVQGAIQQTQKMLGMPNVSVLSDGTLSAPVVGGGSLDMGKFGQVTYSGMPQSGYTGAFSHLVNPPSEPIGGNDRPVEPVDEVTGQCPDGYEFDENLNACRKITPTDYTAMTMPAVPAGRYARMGLLDQPPAGLLEAGFGSPADFTGANLAFRRATAPMSTYFTDPRSYEGYTLI